MQMAGVEKSRSGPAGGPSPTYEPLRHEAEALRQNLIEGEEYNKGDKQWKL
jgi:hypothetical protein